MKTLNFFCQTMMIIFFYQILNHMVKKSIQVTCTFGSKFLAAIDISPFFSVDISFYVTSSLIAI